MRYRARRRERRLDEIQRETATPLTSIAAGKELLRHLLLAETSNVSFAVETTLASRMYLPHVRRWNLAGFETILHFIEVPSADFAVQRVRERVKQGGHVVPLELQLVASKAPVTEDLELVLEGARRANWDAQHGPAHLRSGRFFISALHRGHLPKPAIDEAEAAHADDLNSPT